MNIDDAFAYLLVDEGGYTNDPNDSGGPTNWGITQGDYSRWLKRPASIPEVRAMTKKVAEQIYSDYYWMPMGLDKIVDSKKATALFDVGVVCGIYQGQIMAQRACNSIGAGLVPDGHIGPLSIQAINQAAPSLFIRDMSSQVESRFRGIVANNPKDEVFLRGWVARARRLLSLI